MASALASNLVFHASSKHIEFDVYFVQDKVLSKDLEVQYVLSHDQVADILTKSLSHSQFQYLHDKTWSTSCTLSFE